MPEESQKGTKIGVVALVSKHLRLEGEPLSALSAQLKQLTSQDREDLAKAGAREFGYSEVTV